MLVDYRGYFYHAFKHGRDGANTDIPSIKKSFAELGYDLTVKKFREVDFRNQDYKDRFILYQSTEDKGLHYKSYIEDILLGLYMQGAVLIPNFLYFRAHHNKVFMEILRDLSRYEKIKNIRAKGYGSYEDFLAELESYPKGVVIKSAAAAAGTKVRLMRTPKEKIRNTKKMSQSRDWFVAVKDLIKSKTRKDYSRQSHYRKKFIVQDFIPGLPCDYRVQVYGDKFYVLLRKTRKRSFRASGSGLFEWTKDLPPGLLDFSQSVFDAFATPYISLDIGYDGEDYYLFEFQFVSFGTLTLDNSDCYFTKENDRWVTHHERSILEKELVRSVVAFIENERWMKRRN
jgi:glutathione synthase/RimK-type ligase-like ATP-grasp enzyme